MIRRRHGKTPYELLHNKPPDLSYLHVFGALYYPTNDSENLGKLQPKADIDIFIGYAPIKKAFRIYNRRSKRIVETIHVDFDELTAMASEHSSSGPALHEMMPATSSSGLVTNPHPSTPFVPPSRNDWDMLFQPLFDEFLNPSPSVDLPAPEVVAPEVIAPVLANSTGLPSSTKVDKDAPSPSNSQTTPETEPPVIQNDVEEDNHDLNVENLTKKALYGLKQAPCAWYDMLSSFLISQDFSKGSVDPTLFIRRDGKELLLVQIYVDDIIFAASTPELCFDSCDPVDTPMVEKSKLDEDKEGKVVDPSHYHGMIGTLLYLTASRPDLQFAICMCARYQARPTEKHLNAVKRIFRYLKGTVHEGLWYPKDSSFALTAFTDADDVGCQDTRRRFPTFIKERFENGVIKLYFVNTEYQLADIFTKALGRNRIEFLINKLGMRSFTPETLKQLADEAVLNLSGALFQSHGGRDISSLAKSSESTQERIAGLGGNRLMRTDELHKFSDGTLNHVRTSLNDIATGIQMEYLPKRKWSKQDKQRARVMIKAIDKKLKDRRLMRSLEKFVGGRPYRGDLRLLQRTI
ncbi:retrovirus-related pol polyprotein from transposon TNT 1-94 [Tanacetum coccineum]